MKIILNKTRKSSERYTLISGSMGCYGTPPNHVNNFLEVVGGIDRGNGYQSYSSVSYFLEECRDEEMIRKVKEVVSSLGYIV